MDCFHNNHSHKIYILIHQYFIENSRAVKKICLCSSSYSDTSRRPGLTDRLINDNDDNIDNKADNSDDDNNAFTVHNFHHYKL